MERRNNAVSCFRFPLQRIADGVHLALEKQPAKFAVLFAIVFLSCTIAIDLRSRMWIDELYTLQMARLTSSGDIVRATLEGADGAPPLYAILVHAILPVVRSEALAVRLPSTLGYCGMVIALMAFCQWRMPIVYAWSAALLVCNSALWYATAGRGYGLVLGFAAGALLCWQAADGRRATIAIPLLSIFLGAMTALHYYAVFFVIPLFLAELVRWRYSGRPNAGVLGALLAAPLVLGLHWPLIAATKQFQQHYWSPASWGNIPKLYSSLFADLFVPPLVLLGLITNRQERAEATTPGLTRPEWMAASAFLAMPAVVFLLSRYTTGVYVARYTLWAEIGIAVLVTALVCVRARSNTVVGTALLTALMLLILGQHAYALYQTPVLSASEGVLKELNSLQDNSEPIVVADHHVFMELAYYDGFVNA